MRIRPAAFMCLGPAAKADMCTALNKARNGTPCTTAWPPLLATGRLVAKNGVHQAGLGKMTRNGATQVTYYGHPVYEFLGDKAPGQKNGQDLASFEGIWYLGTPSGRPAAGVPPCDGAVRQRHRAVLAHGIRTADPLPAEL
jgi:hypothetical protein